MLDTAITQEALIETVNKANQFYSGVTGHLPNAAEVQSLLKIVGIDETEEHINKLSGDLARGLATDQETSAHVSSKQVQASPKYFPLQYIWWGMRTLMSQDIGYVLSHRPSAGR